MGKKRVDLGDEEVSIVKKSRLGRDELEEIELSDSAGSQSKLNPLTGRPYTSQYYSILSKREKLPCWDKRKEFIRMVRKNQVTLLVGETGSGKTTQMPQFLLEEFASSGMCVACTQPRRVAAMSVASRVADELDVHIGQEVGYTIRFDDCSSSLTKLKYMTDGMLLREAMTDHLLSRYSVILLDEAHERTLATDLLFGLIKTVLTKRADLRIVVMSATLESEQFAEYFGKEAPLLTVPGRLFPVEINYLAERADNYLDTAIQTVLQLHETEAPGSGDILLFLTGEEEIDNACHTLALKGNADVKKTGELMVVPLYSSLPPHLQQRIFESAPKGGHGKPPGRKVVVATNIAETSITIDGVVYVVDPGFSKQKVYNPRTRVESLLVSPISKASAKQRAGRAGRTKPGQCFRLYTDLAFNELQESTYPELLRSNLASVVLTLLRLGVTDLVHFDFMSPPAPETLMRALEQLHYLGAIDDEGDLTELGNQMSEFPLDPLLAAAVIKSAKLGVSEGVLSVVAMLSVPPVFMRPRDAQKDADWAKQQFAADEGDHITLMRVFDAYREAKSSYGNGDGLHEWCLHNFLNHRSLKSAEDIREQLRKNLMKIGVKQLSVMSPESPHYSGSVRKALLAGFFLHVAVLDKGIIYQTVTSTDPVALHPSSVITNKPEWVFYNEFVLTAKKFIRTVSTVEPGWLLEIAPHFFKQETLTKDAWKKLEKYAKRK